MSNRDPYSDSYGIGGWTRWTALTRARCTYYLQLLITRQLKE